MLFFKPLIRGFSYITQDTLCAFLFHCINRVLNHYITCCIPQEFIPLTFSPQVKKQTMQHTVQISPVQIHAIFLKYINQPDGIVINICAVSCHGVKLLVHLW